MTKLRKKILELEKLVFTQTKLIEILKSMPGCQGVSLGKKKGKQHHVRKRSEKASGEVSGALASARESVDDCKSSGGGDADVASLEKGL